MKRILSTLALLGTFFLLPLMAQAQKYTITINQVEHATIKVTYGSYSSPTEVNSGDQVDYYTMLTIQVIPDEGYEATHYIVNGVEKPVTSSRGDWEFVKEDLIISAKVAPASKCKVTITQPENGTLSVMTTKDRKQVKTGDELYSGTEIYLSVTPAQGYDIEAWLIDGQSYEPSTDKYIRYGYRYTVKKDVTVSVKLKKISQPNPTEGKITMIQPEHGTLTAYYFSDGNTVDVTDGATVPLEKDVTFHVAPAEGYEIDYWMVNDNREEAEKGSLANNKTITVTGDLEVKPVLKAKAAPQPKTVLVKLSYEGVGGYLETTYLEPGGSGNPLKIFGNKDIPVGSVVTVRAKFFMKGDYQVVYTNNGNAVPAETLSEDGLVYTFTANEDADVHAVFSEKPAPAVDYTIKFEAGEGGKVTATVDMEPIESGAKIAAGTQIKILAEPNENYEIDQWLVNGEPVANTGLSFYYIKLMKDTNVKVTFRSTLPPAEYAVTVEPVLPSAKAGTVQLFKKDGSVIASGKTVVTGTEMYVEVKPADKYELETLQVNNTTIKAGDEKLIKLADGGFKYAFTVTEATKIKATFKLVNAIEQLTESQIAVYVTNDGTRLEVAGAAEGAEVRLYDYTGQLLLTSTEHALDISALPAGGYIVLVGNYTTRIVK